MAAAEGHSGLHAGAFGSGLAAVAEARKLRREQGQAVHDVRGIRSRALWNAAAAGAGGAGGSGGVRNAKAVVVASLAADDPHREGVHRWKHPPSDGPERAVV